MKETLFLVGCIVIGAGLLAVLASLGGGRVGTPKPTADPIERAHDDLNRAW